MVTGLRAHRSGLDVDEERAPARVVANMAWPFFKLAQVAVKGVVAPADASDSKGPAKPKP